MYPHLIFSNLCAGYYFNHKFKDKQRENIKESLIKLNIIYNDNNGIEYNNKLDKYNNISIPIYVQQLFFNLIKNIKKIFIIKSEYLCLNKLLQQLLIPIITILLPSPFLSSIISVNNIYILNEYIWFIDNQQLQKLRELENGKWLKCKQQFVHNFDNNDNDNDNDHNKELENNISTRANWKKGSNVLIYCNIKNKFVSGIIDNIYVDTGKEWIKVKYDENNLQSKIVERFSKDIKPCIKKIKFNIEIRRCSSSNKQYTSFKLNIFDSSSSLSINNNFIKFSIYIEEIKYCLNGWPMYLQSGSSKIIQLFKNDKLNDNNISSLTLKISVFHP